MNRLIDLDYALEVLPLLVDALGATVQAGLLSFLLAAGVGLLLAVGRRSRLRLVRWPVAGFVEAIRSTPLLIQLYFMFFVLPRFGVTLSALTTGVLALGLHYSTYASEVYRAGLESVPKGQWDAAVALNLGRYRTLRDIVIPQAIPPVVPALGNYLIALFKETPLLSAIGVMEIMQTAKVTGSQTFRYTEPITLVGIFFLALSLGSAVVIDRADAWAKGRKA